MRGISFSAFGGPEVLEVGEVAEPEMRGGDLLVEVYAAGLNPVDTKIRSGGHGELPLPIVPGYDVSGVVKEVGDEVDGRFGFKIGDEVFASPHLRRSGSHAERVAVDARTVSLKPGKVDHVSAAAFPLVTLTAWEALHERAQIRTGETVLVQGGAGGVGHLGVQLAKLHGCKVITTASQKESIAFCKELGADVVINYKEEDVVARVKEETGGKGCEVVVDTVGGKVFEESMDCLAVYGRLVGIVLTKTDLIFDKMFRIGGTLHLEFMGVRPIADIEPERHGQILRQAAELIDGGKLRTRVHEVIGLEDLARAHAEQVAFHTIGKRVVKMRD